MSQLLLPLAICLSVGPPHCCRPVCSSATTVQHVQGAGHFAGVYKQQLAYVCEVLVTLREVLDRESQEQLYTDSLRLLSGGNQQVRKGGAGEPYRLQHATYRYAVAAVL